MTGKIALYLDNDYLNFLDDIKNRLKTAQIRASLAVNKELIHFYWGLGKDLIEKQRQFFGITSSKANLIIDNNMQCAANFKTASA